ncbi:RiPP maturation protein ApyI [Bradyrhizobium betae]|uniref:Uncharacterized protein n=1 Tax=Bradyrhizobium betae TaxID=244734 RepID=A0A4Q1VCJ9_9BRAD|nr:hypothetical protein [Bradyrhizobium betae]RXT47857.1 hypothetical protein B5V03_16510 [Bradyrhizobium betae]
MPRKTETAARHVHATLAAAVADPDALERLCRSGDARRSFDVERIRLFAGLALKVRHNDIRLLLPLTFKLLDRLKISVPIFAAYGKTAAALRVAKRTTQSDKLEVISGFIEGWLRADDPLHALVRDALHHERALLALKDNHAKVPAGTNDREVMRSKATVAPASVVRRATGLIRNEMSCNPLLLATALDSPASDLSVLRRDQLHFVHRWDARRGCATAVEIDELGHVLLELADGRRSLTRLIDMLRRAGVTLTSAELCRVSQQLVDNNLLVVVPLQPGKRPRRAVDPGR